MRSEECEKITSFSSQFSYLALTMIVPLATVLLQLYRRSAHKGQGDTGLYRGPTQYLHSPDTRIQKGLL